MKKILISGAVLALLLVACVGYQSYNAPTDDLSASNTGVELEVTDDLDADVENDFDNLDAEDDLLESDDLLDEDGQQTEDDLQDEPEPTDPPVADIPDEQGAAPTETQPPVVTPPVVTETTPAPVEPPVETPAPVEPPVDEQPQADASDAVLSDLATSLDAIIGEQSFAALDDDILLSVYQVDPSLLDEYVCKMPMMNVRANEYFIAKVGAGNMDSVLAALDQRQATLEAQWEQYLADQYEIVKNSQRVVIGDYVLYVVSDKADAVVSAFQFALA